jgi:hypothetical protein
VFEVVNKWWGATNRSSKQRTLESAVKGTFHANLGDGLNITTNSVSKVYFSLHFDANGFFLSKSLKVF